MENLNQLISRINKDNVPAHVAVIMDGNGRWAKRQNMDRSYGHIKGVDAVRTITEIASETGVKVLTLYTFSTENWNRPKEEVDTLMHLIVTAIERETPDLIKNNVRLGLIGDRSRIPEFALERLEECISKTSGCTGLNLVLAISYSARWEIVNAARTLARKALGGQIIPEEIDDKLFEAALSTAGYPDVDLLIRTGGDLRISNFLLYQIAYSEIYFTPKYWPDFSKEDFVNAILHYQQRERRFGLTSEQIAAEHHTQN